MSIRVILVDDHCLFREGTVQLLNSEPTIQVVECAETVSQALQLLEGTIADVIIIDINLPDQNGFYLIRELAKHENAPKIIVLSGYNDLKYIRTAFQIGAAGFLCKTCSRSELINAIFQVHDGHLVFPNELLSRNGRAALFGTVNQPTKREMEVLSLIRQGLSNKQIADTLFVSERTIHYHVGNILSKLNASSRLEAVVKAKESGWITN